MILIKQALTAALVVSGVAANGVGNIHLRGAASKNGLPSNTIHRFLQPGNGLKPLKVGTKHPMRIVLNPSANNPPNDIEPEVTNDGKSFKYTIDEFPAAKYIAPHFERFKMQDGCVMRISDGSGGFLSTSSQAYEMTGKGKYNMEHNIWSQNIKGPKLVIQLDCEEEPQGFQFSIDEVAVGDIDPFDQVPTGPGERVLAICGEDDKMDALCCKSSHPEEYDKARAVARLLIGGVESCTGWLASESNHLITNEHCISDATTALNTDYEFMAEASSCGEDSCTGCPTVISGAIFMQDSYPLDYSLVQITSGDPAATYGHLQLDNQEAVIDELIYIPGHPGGRDKEIGIESTHPQDGGPGGSCRVQTKTATPCGGRGGPPEVGYYCDTEGGSSGSPVIDRVNHKVIALHHCANCPNRGVPSNLIFAEIDPLLAPCVPACGPCHVCSCGSCDQVATGTPCGTCHVCSTSGSCDQVANGTPCDDGLYCNGHETCVDGTCTPGTVVDCDDNNDCTDDSCNEGTNSYSCDNVFNEDNEGCCECAERTKPRDCKIACGGNVCTWNKRGKECTA